MSRFSRTKRLAVSLLMAFLIGLPQVAPAGAAGHKVCKAYATNAVWQHDRNLKARCGFAGLRWHYAWQLHYNWCRGVEYWLTRQERSIRRQALISCGAL